MNIFRKKSIEALIASSQKNSFKKSLTAFDLVLIGIGCTIGTGIFVVTGTASAIHAGPAIAVSYLISALVCLFAALAYAEIASMVPVSGSAYTYTYAVVGEFVAWLVGWGLVLEYGIGASAVANGWSGYMVGILESANIILPDYLTKPTTAGGLINLPASLIVLLIGLMLFVGTKQGVTFNRILVFVKLVVIFIFLVVATPMVKTVNYSDFMPFGFTGIMAGSAAIFYAYIGFDAVATTAEECKNPKRDLPIGIIVSLGVCALLYAVVALVLNGIVNYTTLNNAEPLARALRDNGSNIGSALVSTGAVAGITSVLLVLLYGQSRIFFVMSRDGLLPKKLSSIHKKYNTPHVSVILTTLGVALLAGVFSLETLSEMTSIGTLFGFIVVAMAVMILRIKQPNLKRSFKCPLVFVVAPLAILSCGYLTFELLTRNWHYFVVWTLCGILIYFLYGYRKSTIAK
ncbi:MAG: amino acid permease [Proteobacteria bacterium]|nr:amino acid permease [Pseudomonadota bacterium]NCA28401.1 amino acid permease [Pseudomonadota bacterium]